MCTKPRLVILGSSHATRLYNAIRENSQITEKFEVLSNTKPGATFETLKINFGLIYSLTPRDYLCIQFLGNDLLKRHIKITKNPKVIHLEKFIPQSNKNVHEKRESLRNILSIVQAKIYIIDDPLRHVNCCSVHNHPGLMSYLHKRNKELKQYFGNSYEVLDHRKLINEPFRKLKCIFHYKKILVDAVHLRPEYYQQWAQAIFLLISK
jgi:hypothetical protein